MFRFVPNASPTRLPHDSWNTNELIEFLKHFLIKLFDQMQQTEKFNYFVHAYLDLKNKIASNISKRLILYSSVFNMIAVVDYLEKRQFKQQQQQ